MKRLFKKFALRGLVFSGFGPVIYAIVMLCIDLSNVNSLQNGLEVFKGVLSTYLLAFICAGSSIIWEEEKLGLGFAILIHGSLLYVCYLITYLVNSWIKMSLKEVGIFSIIFISGYLLVWIIIFIIEKIRAKSFNKKMHLN